MATMPETPNNSSEWIPVPSVPEGGLFSHIPLRRIALSPTNPRKNFDERKIAELAESIAQHGILQPLVVRAKGDEAKIIYEIVAGERRFRAAQLLGLEMLPAVVRVLSDRDVAEIQVIENSQREDLHPLEEAEGFARILGLGYDVDHLAEKIGKSRSYVYGRMKLAELCEDVKAAVYDGTLPASHALEIARIPDDRLQKQVFTKIMEGAEYHGQPRSFRELKRIIKTDFQLQLNSAAFDTAASIEFAGALPHPCTICPHRSGNQSDLFDDFDDADVCTLPPCFHAKEEAAWQLEREKDAKKGIKVFPLAQGKKIAPWGYVQGSSYLDIGKPLDGHSGPLLKTLLPKDAKIAVLRDGYGKTHKVIAKKDLKPELERAGVKVEEEAKPSRGNQVDQEPWELREKIEDAIGLAIAAGVELALTPELEQTILVALLIDYEGGLPPAVDRAQLKTGEDHAWARGLSRQQLFAYMAEAIYAREGWETDEKKRRKEFLALIGVDEKVIEKQVRREWAAEHAPKEKPAKTKGAKKSKAKEFPAGVCQFCGCTEEDACEGGCSWANDEKTVCSQCAGEEA